MFNVLTQQIKIFSAPFASYLDSNDRFSGLSSPSKSEMEKATERSDMTYLIENRKIDIKDPSQIEFIKKFLRDVAKENNGKITEDQIGGIFSRTGTCLSILVSLIDKKDGQTGADILNNFMTGTETSSGTRTEVRGDTKEITKQTKELVTKSYDDVIRSFQEAVKPYREKKVALSQEEKDKIIQAISIAQRQISEITQAGNTDVKRREEVIREIQAAQAKLLNGFGTIKTKEQIGVSPGSTFLGMSVDKGGKSRTDEVKSFSAETKASLAKILKRENLPRIAVDLINLSPKDKETGSVVFGTFHDSSKFEKYLKDLGYVVDGFRFDIDELHAVYQTILDYNDNQTLVPSLNDVQKMEMLFDFDQNGFLETDLNFSIGEMQMYYTVLQSASRKSLDNFLGNLGMGTMEKVSKDMYNNLYSVREKFKRSLGKLIELRVKPGELLQAGGTSKAVDALYKEQDAKTKELDENLKGNKELQKKLSTITDIKERESIFEKIRLSGVALMLGSSNGIGFSFDIKEFTNNYIDAIQIGFIKGTLIPTVGFSWELFNKNGYGANFSLTTLGPVLSGTAVSDSGLAGTGAITLLGLAVAGGYERIDLETSKGIQRELEKMEDNLSILKKDILAGKDFSKSEFSKIKGSTSIFYNEFKDAYDTYGKSYGERFLNDITNAYLTQYKNELFYQAQGLKFTSIGLAGAIGFVQPFLMLLPYIGFERIKQTYTPVNTRIGAEREATSSNSTENPGFVLTTYKGKQVYVISEVSGYYNISHPDGKVQAEREGGMLYFSGKITSLAFNEHITNTGVEKTIVLNGGGIQENEKFIPAGMYPITDNVEYSGITKATSNNIELDRQAIESTKVSRENIFNIIWEDALNHSKTPGMQKLQKMIFDYANGRGNLNDVWLQFLSVINNPKFTEYAQEKGALQELGELKTFIMGNLNNSEKILILQSIPACLMKKEALKIRDGEVNVGKKLRDYDKRDAFFDGIFREKFSGLLPQIQSARKAWFDANGNATSYSFKNVSDGSIAFSATQSKKSNGSNNVSGLMTYEGAYHVVDAGTPFIDIPGRHPSVVNNLGNEYLNNLKNQLNLYGAGLNTIQDVKSFINSGGRGDIRLNYNVKYAKMGECMNDAITIDLNLVVSGKVIILGSSLSSEVYATNNDSTKFLFSIAGNPIKLKKDKPEEDEKSTTEENEKSTTEENEKSTTEENESSTTQEDEKSTTTTEPESSETTTEPEGSETSEPESTQTQEPESSQTSEPESSQTSEPESSQTQEPESSQTAEPEGSQTQSEPESSQTQTPTEGEGSNTTTPPPSQVDE